MGWRWEERTLTDRGATEPAPWLEASLLGSDAPASLRAPRSVNVLRDADKRMDFVTWVLLVAVAAAIFWLLSHPVVWS